MKNAFLVFALICSLCLIGCDQSSSGDTGGGDEETSLSLTVKNLSSFDLKNISWGQAVFSDLNSGASDTKQVSPDVNLIFFSKVFGATSSTPGSFYCRVRDIIAVDNENVVFSFTDNAIVIERDDSENIQSLGTIVSENVIPPDSAGITNITYSGLWTLQGDGRYRSNAISPNGQTTMRVNFTATAGSTLTIQLDVSSDLNSDWAYIGKLDSSGVSDYITSNRISGDKTRMVDIPVPAAGNHFVNIWYVKGSYYYNSSGSDCAWFRVIN
jgi:hypothetical protein